MKSKYVKYLSIITIFLLFFICANTKNAVALIGNLDYFVSNANQAGFIIATDTAFLYPSKHIRQIRINHAVSYSTIIFRPYEIIVKAECDSESFSGIGLPVVRNPDGLKIFRRITFEKHEDTTLKDWAVVFIKDSCLYQINSRDLTFGDLLWFARKFKSVIFSKDISEIDSIFSVFKRERANAAIDSKIQSLLHNYTSDKSIPNEKRIFCYSGKIIQFPGDTLSPNDSADFRDCVIQYRRDHGLEPAFIIDTCLFKSLKIPLNPIEEGFKRYHQEFAKKSR